MGRGTLVQLGGPAEEEQGTNMGCAEGPVPTTTLGGRAVAGRSEGQDNEGTGQSLS